MGRDTSFTLKRLWSKGQNNHFNHQFKTFSFLHQQQVSEFHQNIGELHQHKDKFQYYRCRSDLLKGKIHHLSIKEKRICSASKLINQRIHLETAQICPQWVHGLHLERNYQKSKIGSSCILCVFDVQLFILQEVRKEIKWVRLKEDRNKDLKERISASRSRYKEDAFKKLHQQIQEHQGGEDPKIFKDSHHIMMTRRDQSMQGRIHSITSRHQSKKKR